MREEKKKSWGFEKTREKGEGKPLSRTRRAVLLVAVEEQDRGEQISGAYLSYRPGRARSTSEAPRTGKGSALQQGSVGR